MNRQPGEQWEPSEVPAPEFLKDESDERVLGRYAQCSRLLMSPRFNRPQREIIQEEAEGIRSELEARGMTAREPVGS